MNDGVQRRPAFVSGKVGEGPERTRTGGSMLGTRYPSAHPPEYGEGKALICSGQEGGGRIRSYAVRGKSADSTNQTGVGYSTAGE